MTVTEAVMGEDEAVMAAAAAHAGGALATVLTVAGSAYRREGSRMLVLPDGSTVGGVSGGCLEAEVAALALETAKTGRARVLRFDTTTPEDAVMGYGSGCAGAIDVLVEPRGPQAADLNLAALAAARSTRRPSLLATALAGPLTGAHAWWHQGRWTGRLADDLSLPSVPAGPPVRGSTGTAGRSSALSSSDPATVVPIAWEVIDPPLRLVLVGADAGAQELARAARQLGWDVLVVDFRPRLLDADRFPPGVKMQEAVGSQLAGAVPLDPATAVVVASRHWLYDLAAVDAVLKGDRPASALYVGLIGSQARVSGLLAKALGDRPLPHRVHAPAGLDLGARTPAEIAAAVVGEILAVRSTRPGSSSPADVGAGPVPSWDSALRSELVSAVTR